MSRNDKKAVDPFLIYQQAEGFSLAHDALCNIDMPIAERMLTGSATVVLSAMSSELFLKCLICIQTGRAPRGHYLKQLFDQLEPDTRKRIIAVWDAKVVPRHRAQWDAMEAGLKVRFPRDLPSILALANKAFEKVRYSYEGDLDGVAYLLSDLPAILKFIALLAHPEWAQRRPKVEEWSKPDEAA
jgi:hypothetical protein